MVNRHGDRVGRAIEYFVISTVMESAAVVRYDHKHIDTPTNQRLDIADLTRVIAVGRLHQNIGAELLSAGDKQIAIALSAFFLERVHGKADERSGARLDVFRRRSAARNHKAGDKADDARSDNEKYSELHFG